MTKGAKVIERTSSAASSKKWRGIRSNNMAVARCANLNRLLVGDDEQSDWVGDVSLSTTIAGVFVPDHENEDDNDGTGGQDEEDDDETNGGSISAISKRATDESYLRTQLLSSRVSQLLGPSKSVSIRCSSVSHLQPPRKSNFVLFFSQTFSKTDGNIAMFGKNFNDSMEMNRKNYEFILSSIFSDFLLDSGKNVRSSCSANKILRCGRTLRCYISQ